jgi:hypothetical protein
MKTQVIKKDLLILAFDTKTGRVSVDGGPFRELQMTPVPPPPHTPTPPDKEPDPPTPGPVDDYICGRRSGEPMASCRWFFRIGGQYYDSGVSCVGHPFCYLIP